MTPSHQRTATASRSTHTADAVVGGGPPCQPWGEQRASHDRSPTGWRAHGEPGSVLQTATAALPERRTCRPHRRLCARARALCAGTPRKDRKRTCRGSAARGESAGSVPRTWRLLCTDRRPVGKLPRYPIVACPGQLAKLEERGASGERWPKRWGHAGRRPRRGRGRVGASQGLGACLRCQGSSLVRIQEDVDSRAPPIQPRRPANACHSTAKARRTASDPLGSQSRNAAGTQRANRGR